MCMFLNASFVLPDGTVKTIAFQKNGYPLGVRRAAPRNKPTIPNTTEIISPPCVYKVADTDSSFEEIFSSKPTEHNVDDDFFSTFEYEGDIFTDPYEDPLSLYEAPSMFQI